MCFFAQIPLLVLHARFAAKVTWTAISEIRSHFRITIKAWSIILWTPDCGNTSLGKHQTKLCSAKCRLDRTLFQNTYPSRWFNNTYQGAKGLLDQGPFWSIIQVVYSCLGSLWPRTLLVKIIIWWISLFTLKWMRVEILRRFSAALMKSIIMRKSLRVLMYR